MRAAPAKGSGSERKQCGGKQWHARSAHRQRGRISSVGQLAGDDGDTALLCATGLGTGGASGGGAARGTGTRTTGAGGGAGAGTTLAGGGNRRYPAG
jgi:hypothetical protein